jgi:hypothetical protein
VVPSELLPLLLVHHVIQLLVLLQVVLLLVLWLLILGRASGGTGLCLSEASPPLLSGCQLAGV